MREQKTKKNRPSGRFLLAAVKLMSGGLGGGQLYIDAQCGDVA